MARPSIVRADTLDLQDQENPSAAEHTKHPSQHGLAPHQAAEMNHVIEERHSEEQSLADAWASSGNMNEEPTDAANGHQHAGHDSNNEAGEHGAADDTEGESDDDMMDRISSSPSIEDEDIDFEFVYALHTFVATVEGQANATKGDTMVLLDDSNSYWWLVRVVKDSSIGYLPAEHIETPTERLARLNKHRNIDLSATMLSDNSEKTRNPLKKAMRRRNAKTVQFAAPTYVEASDYDYSSDEEEHALVDQVYGANGAEPSEEGQQSAQATNVEKDVTEPESTADTHERTVGTPNQRLSFDREQAATAAIAASVDEPQLSPKLVDKTEAAPLKSRKGTPRNTDSFLKDDTIETRKITLTPGLLREDSVKTASSESTRSGSMENLVKQVSPTDQDRGKKDGKDKKKDKSKGGMLSGLFKSKKKDKKAKDDGAESDAEKASTEYARAESPRNSPHVSGASSPTGRSSPVSVSPQVRQPQAPTAARGKLQKQPPSNASSSVREVAPPAADETTNAAGPSVVNASSGNAFVAELQGSEAAYEMSTGMDDSGRVDPPTQSIAHSVRPEPTTIDRNGPLSPLTNMMSSTNDKQLKPEQAQHSRQRAGLDDFDSGSDDDRSNNYNHNHDERERLSESPVEIAPGTFMHGTESIHIPTFGPDGPEDVVDNEEADSFSSSPSIINHPSEALERADVAGDGTLTDNDPTPTARSPLQRGMSYEAQRSSPPPGLFTPHRAFSSASTSSTSSGLSATNDTSHERSNTSQSWSDSNLRAWYDDGSDIKDMLLMIHDKSGVTPVADDHPMMQGLFVEQKKGVAKMMGELDDLLGSFLKRKGVNMG